MIKPVKNNCRLANKAVRLPVYLNNKTHGVFEEFTRPHIPDFLFEFHTCLGNNCSGDKTGMSVGERNSCVEKMMACVSREVLVTNDPPSVSDDCIE